MKVGVVASDVPPCEFYRAAGPARCLAEAGEIEYVRLSEPLSVKMAVRQHGSPEPVKITNPPEVDVVVFVRGVFPARMHEIIKLLQREGIAVVVDYDDAYRHLPPELHELYRINPTQNPHYNWKWAEEASKFADAVTVSTPALLRYHPNATVLRNRVPKSYLNIKRKSDGKTIGWSGVVAGHPNDLPQCGGGVVEALRATDSRFLVVGNSIKVREQLGLDKQPASTDIVPLEQYPYELARLDVGIAPLALTAYSEAKSWLKPIEYLALGACFVASPTSEYNALYEDLVLWCGERPVPGAIARSRGREWKRELRRFLEADREELSLVARSYIRERHLMEEGAYGWADVWEQAVKNRRAKRSVL